MATNKDLCSIIEKVDSDLGECGKDYDVSLDQNNNAYVIDYHNDKHHLKTFLNKEDVDLCVDENKCMSLKFETGQLRYNFNKYLKEHSFRV